MTDDAQDRTMTMHRVIAAPLSAVWAAWINPDSLPLWWGPDGFTCRTDRIDLRTGGEWVFDMIAADGTVYPNHHLYTLIQAEKRICYTLLWGENGPKHADAVVTMAEVEGATHVTMAMTFTTVDEYHQAAAFGAEALGQQTLGKLAVRVVG